MRATLVLPIVGFLSTALLAQSPEPSLDRAARLVAEAEKHITDQDAVGATLLLWRAEDALDPFADDVASAAVRKSVDRLLGRVDPLDGRRRETRAAIAERVVDFAKRYTRKRWYRTSHRLLEYAARFDAEAARKPLAYVTKKLPAEEPEPDREAGSGEPSGERPLLAQVQTTFVTAGWDYRDGVLHSPRFEDRHTPVYLCSSPSMIDGELRVDLQIGPVEGGAALVFGAQGLDDYFMAEVWQFGPDGAASLSLFHFDYDGKNREAKLLAKGYVKADKTRPQRFATLVLRVDGDRTRVSFDGSKPVEATLPRRGAGGIGFVIPGNSPNKEPVHFRDLQVGPLTGEAESSEKAGEPSPAQPVLDAIAEAEGYFEAGDDEDGVLALRRAKAALGELETGTLHDVLEEQVDELRDEHDPLVAAAREVEKEIGGDWGALAGLYLEAGRKRLAWELFRAAAQLDAERWQESVDDLEVELAETLVEERGLPAEEGRATVSNDLLVGAFEASRQYWALDPWRLTENGLRSPTLGPDGGAMVLFDAEVCAGQRAASVQTRLLEGRGDFGLIFGAKSSHELCLLSVAYGAPDGAVSVWRLVSGSWKEVLRRKVRFSPEARAAWATLRVELLDDGKVRCRVGTDEAFECTLGTDLPSRYGLYVGTHPKAKGQATTEFAALRWTFGN